MLFSALIDEVIGEVGDDVDDSDLETKVLGFVKSALRRFPQNARARSIISKKSVSLASAAQTGTIPSGFIQERAAWYEDSEGVRHDITIIRDTKLFNERYRTNVSGAPEFCRFYGTTIEFNRPANQAYTVYVDCFIEIDNVAAADTFAYDSSMAEIMKDGVKFYYYTYTEDDDNKKTWGTLFLDDLRKLDSKYVREETPDHVEES